MKLLTTHFSPHSCYTIPLTSKYSISTLFSNILRLCSSNIPRDQFSYPYITTYNLTNFCISVWTSLSTGQEDNTFELNCSKYFSNLIWILFLHGWNFDWLIFMLLMKLYSFKFEELRSALSAMSDRNYHRRYRTRLSRKYTRAAFCPGCTVSFTTKCSWIIERRDSSQSICLRGDQIENQKKLRWMDTCHGSLPCRNSGRFYLPLLIKFPWHLRRQQHLKMRSSALLRERILRKGDKKFATVIRYNINRFWFKFLIF